MNENRKKKDEQKNCIDDVISRRNFIKKIAYIPPVVMTFIASEANACQVSPPANKCGWGKGNNNWGKGNNNWGKGNNNWGKGHKNH